MTSHPVSATRARPVKPAVLAVVLALLLGAAVAVVERSPGPSVGLKAGVVTAPPPAAVTTRSQSRATALPARHDRGAPPSAPTALAGEGVAGPGGSPFDQSDPTVSKLDPALLDALRTAARAAEADGVRIHVNSGWRSAAEQERLLRQAVADYGSEKEARRWVATPETSEHVSGDAVDLGPTRAAQWLAEHGAGYGLCQVYRNEPWHFELRQGAALGGCPALYADPTQDPRMSR